MPIRIDPVETSSGVRWWNSALYRLAFRQRPQPGARRRAQAKSNLKTIQQNGRRACKVGATAMQRLDKRFEKRIKEAKKYAKSVEKATKRYCKVGKGIFGEGKIRNNYRSDDEMLTALLGSSDRHGIRVGIYKQFAEGLKEQQEEFMQTLAYDPNEEDAEEAAFYRFLGTENGIEEQLEDGSLTPEDRLKALMQEVAQYDMKRNVLQGLQVRNATKYGELDGHAQAVLDETRRRYPVVAATAKGAAAGTIAFIAAVVTGIVTHPVEFFTQARKKDRAAAAAAAPAP